jgi:hypothetical protein
VYEHITTVSKVETCTEIVNILSATKGFKIKESCFAQVVTEFKAILGEVYTEDDRQRQRLNFLVEQIELALISSKKRRRYSAGMLTIK